MKEEVRGHRVAIDSLGLVVSLPNPSLSLLLSLTETRDVVGAALGLLSVSG